MTDDDYLSGYARTDIHVEMLDDRKRTMTYRRALLDADLDGKVVLDVGCGTGILSLFAAEAGARKVHAVDASGIATLAKKVVSDNGFDAIIEVHHCKVEDLELPEKVDVIVSEWMGYFLIFERMLDSVLIARDRFLKPGGRMLPGTAAIQIAGMEDFEYEAKRFAGFDRVYGFDLSALGERRRFEAVVDEVDPRALVTDTKTVFRMDTHTMVTSDQDFSVHFELTARRNDTMHAMVGAFDVGFNGLELRTDADAPVTHWKQTIFYLERPLRVRKGDKIPVKMSCRADPASPRNLIIDLDVGQGKQRTTGTFRL